RLGGSIEAVAPTIIIGKGGRGGTVGWKGQVLQFTQVVVEILKAGLDIAQRQARRREGAPVVLGVLIDNLALAPGAQACDVGDVQRVALRNSRCRQWPPDTPAARPIDTPP